MTKVNHNWNIYLILLCIFIVWFCYWECDIYISVPTIPVIHCHCTGEAGGPLLVVMAPHHIPGYKMGNTFFPPVISLGIQRVHQLCRRSMAFHVDFISSDPSLGCAPWPKMHFACFMFGSCSFFHKNSMLRYWYIGTWFWETPATLVLFICCCNGNKPN